MYQCNYKRSVQFQLVTVNKLHLDGVISGFTVQERHGATGSSIYFSWNNCTYLSCIMCTVHFCICLRFCWVSCGRRREGWPWGGSCWRRCLQNVWFEKDTLNANISPNFLAILMKVKVVITYFCLSVQKIYSIVIFIYHP